MSGSLLRLGRLFNAASGRSFMVAFDRSLPGGPVRFAENSATALAQIIATGADGVLVSPGLIKQHGHLFAHRGAPGIVLRIDLPQFADFAVGEGEFSHLISTPEEAARLGADAVVMFLLDGLKDGRVAADQAAALAEMARRCTAVGLPLIVEAVLWGAERIKDSKNTERLARICRVAAELGADAVKTEYPGSLEGMRTIVEGCPVPVLVLGGSKLDDPREVQGLVRDSLAAGARGVIFGRNVWQRADMAPMAHTIREAVHASV